MKTLQISVAEFKQSLLLHLILILCFNSNRYFEYNLKLNIYINYKKNYFEANKQSNFGTITNINTNIYYTKPTNGKTVQKEINCGFIKKVRELIYLIFSFFRYVYCLVLSKTIFLLLHQFECEVTLYMYNQGSKTTLQPFL